MCHNSQARVATSVVKIPVIFVWVILPVLLRFFLVILGNICKNITISNKSSKNINCMYSATLKIYTFDRNLKKITL
jgi:hypothetical protein